MPTLPPMLTLLRLTPSPQVLSIRQFRTIPLIPDAQKPELACWIQKFSINQLAPPMSTPPPSPSTVARLGAFASSDIFLAVHDVMDIMAANGVALGSGTFR